MSQLSSYEHRWEFSAEQHHQLEQFLSEYLLKTKSTLVVLTDMSGQLICYKGQGSSKKIVALGNLAAAGLAASSEIDNYLYFSQKNHIQHLLLEGKNKNIYISIAAEKLLLITVFSNTATIATVRIHSDQICQKISSVAQAAIYDHTKLPSLSDLQIDRNFEAEIDRQLDQLFGKNEKF